MSISLTSAAADTALSPQFQSQPKEASPLIACKADPRFSYSFRCPREVPADTPILVVIHGNMRSVERTRDAFADFARWNDCIVLAPLFPVGVLGDDNKDGFKFIQEGDIRYDHVLLSMVDEVKARFGLCLDRFGLFGFAGGAQFANRFTLLHAAKLWGVSIAAPGSVTLLDFDRTWWVGVKDVADRFGVSVDIGALRALPIQLLVGTADVDPGTDENSIAWVPGGRDAGETAYVRLQSLRTSLHRHGINLDIDLIHRKGHELMDVVDPAKFFFKACLRDLADRAAASSR